MTSTFVEYFDISLTDICFRKWNWEIRARDGYHGPLLRHCGSWRQGDTRKEFRTQLYNLTCDKAPRVPTFDKAPRVPNPITQFVLYRVLLLSWILCNSHSLWGRVTLLFVCLSWLNLNLIFQNLEPIKI